MLDKLQQHLGHLRGGVRNDDDVTEDVDAMEEWKLCLEDTEVHPCSLPGAVHKPGVCQLASVLKSGIL